MIMLNWLALGLSIIVIILVHRVIEKDDFFDLSLYEQGALDWSSRSWVDF